MPGASTPNPVALMGAQRLDPRVRDLADALGAEEPFALVTAGWQGREREDEELRAHLAGAVVNLELNERARTVFAEDPELAVAYRRRQDLLRHLQAVYRVRLHHAFAAELDVRTYRAPEAIRSEIDEASIAAIRALDDDHLAQCKRLQDEFEARWRPAERPAVRRQIEAITRALEPCLTVCIAGGNVAVIRNRMAFFGLPAQLAPRTVLGWSAGAMVLTDRIVLFHDDAPQGEVLREVLDYGFGLVSNLVVFPEPERRLDTEDRDSMRLMVQRLAPARGVLLEASSHVVFEGGHLVAAQAARTIDERGVPHALEVQRR